MIHCQYSDHKEHSRVPKHLFGNHFFFFLKAPKSLQQIGAYLIYKILFKHFIGIKGFTCT